MARGYMATKKRQAGRSMPIIVKCHRLIVSPSGNEKRCVCRPSFVSNMLSSSSRILYSTKNLTPKGMSEVSRFKILLEAEILCFLHAVQGTEDGKLLESNVDLFRS